MTVYIHVHVRTCIYTCVYVHATFMPVMKGQPNPPRSPYGIVPGGAPPAEQMGGGGGGGGGGEGGGMGGVSFGENHILLFTVFNPLYPITVVSEYKLNIPLCVLRMLCFM